MEERSKADMDFCLLLFNRCLNAGVSDEDIVKVFRLGKRSERARPLLIQFASYSIKNLVNESLYKLKNAEQKFKGINIVHDMTLNERIECWLQKQSKSKRKILRGNTYTGFEVTQGK